MLLREIIAFLNTSVFRLLALSILTDVRNTHLDLTMAMTMLHHLGQVVVREAEGGEYNGEVGWERVDRAFKLRSRNK